MGGRSGQLILLHDPALLATRTGEVARVLARALRQPVPDVALRVRNGGGILARDVQDELAEKVVADLAAAGIAAFAVSAEDAAITLPRTKRLAGIAIGDAGLTGSIRGSTKREDLRWERVRALHVNVFAHALTPEEQEDGRSARPLPDVKHVAEDVVALTAEIDLWEDRERRRVELCLDLVARDPLLVARVIGEEADYAALPEKGASAIANFVLLVRALVKAAPPGVLVPPSTRRFAESLDWKGILFEKPEQRDSFNLWLVLAAERPDPFGVAGPTETAEDVADDEVEDEDDDADDVADDDAEDDDDADDEEDDEDDADEASEPPANGAAIKPKDADVAQALELFDKTRKLRKSDVAELVAAAQELDDKAAETDEVPPSVEAELQFFEEQKTGRWDVNDIVKDSQALDDKDVADEKSDTGA